MRRKIVGASWKMHVNSIAEGIELASGIHKEVGDIEDVDIFILPSFPLIKGVSDIFQSGNIGWGAQNMCFDIKGAYTGEVPAQMLKELNCKYIELAHAERKAFFNETDETVNKKIKICEDFDFTPVVCIGETEEDVQNGKGCESLKTQILTMLDGINREFAKKIILAYEPVWAIGKAETAGLEYIADMHGFIRQTIKIQFGEDVSEHIRIIYGGSVNPETSDDLLGLPNVDGVFIGRFGLNPKNFKKITESAIKNIN